MLDEATNGKRSSTEGLPVIPKPNVFVSERTDESPITLTELFKSNAKYLFIAGQNLHTLARESMLQQTLLQFLKREETRVDLLICDPHVRCCFNCWDLVNPAKGKYGHKSHLRDSVKKFRGLQEKIGRERLKIRVTDLFPYGTWVMDPEEENGVMVITPVIPTGDDSSERPQFFVNRLSNTVAFDYYWNRLKKIFREEGLSRDLPTVWQSLLRTIQDLLPTVIKLYRKVQAG